MRHHFAQPAREEVPSVPRPDPLGVKAFDQLSDDCLNAPPLLHQPKRPSLLLPLSRTIGCEQAQTLPGQFLTQGRTPVVAITQGPTPCLLQQPPGHRQLMHISWPPEQAN